MRNFLMVAAGIDVLPLLQAVVRQPDLWNQNKFRTTFENTPHGEVDDIWVRFSKETPNTNQVADDMYQTVWYPAFEKLPQVIPIIRDLMFRFNGYELQRCVITRLRPGGRILPHADNKGNYVHAGDISRYHVVLQGLPGSLYRTGDETVNMKTGEVWWFNAHLEHEVINNSVDDRIHLLVDFRRMQ